MTSPRVSIGMPVHNGERFIVEALDSILAQTFEDFELVICDNASTDRTAEICRDVAAGDRRIRYHRQAENIGAAGNYNDTFRRSRGAYFKWAAHDDMIAPDFLAACLARLEADPGAAVAFARMREIDAEGHMIGDYDAPILWQGQSPAARLDSLFRPPNSQSFLERCIPITGLIRSEILKKTRLICNFNSSDKITVVELALQGDFIEIPERLFLRRMHSGSSREANLTAKEIYLWFDPKARPVFVTPRIRLLMEFYRSIKRSNISFREKSKCYISLSRLARRDMPLFMNELKIATIDAIKGR